MQSRLKNITVVWVGSEKGGETLLEACRAEGAKVERQPLIVFAPPDNLERLEAACQVLERFSWIVFTSAQAVRALAGQARPRAKIAAVGPSTRDALLAIGWSADLVPRRNDSFGLVREFQKIPKPDNPILFVRGDRAKRTLPEGLISLGFPLEEVVAYCTREVTPKRALEIAIRLKEMADVVLAGSPSGVETLEKAVGAGGLGSLGPNIRWVCLGESTFAALRKGGISDPIFPEAVIPSAVVDAVVRSLQGKS
jgi:uroporphyrinogen-III synthase